jgi:riboflavin transporter FmnP
MPRRITKPLKISIVALMIALSTVFELINHILPLRVPWGMSVDLVAVPVMITFFILGTRYSLLAGVGMFLMLCAFGYANVLGAVMKFAATIPMVLTLGLFLLTPLRNKVNPIMSYRSPWRYGIASVGALAARCAVAVALNYIALPIFFGMPMSQIIQTVFFGSIWGFVVFVAGLNITQGIIDLAVPWILVFGFKLSERFSGAQVETRLISR